MKKENILFVFIIILIVIVIIDTFLLYGELTQKDFKITTVIKKLYKGDGIYNETYNCVNYSETAKIYFESLGYKVSYVHILPTNNETFGHRIIKIDSPIYLDAQIGIINFTEFNGKYRREFGKIEEAWGGEEVYSKR